MLKHSLLFCLLVMTLQAASAQMLISSSSQADTALPAVTSLLTDIQFEHTVFNYGDIMQGEKVQTVFKFINTGDEPLIISSVKGSCGCTVPSWPKAPVAPGETAELVVRFDSKGKSGQQSKRVTIFANVETGITYLTVKGQVITADTKLPVQSGLAASGIDLIGTFIDVDRANLSLYPNPTTDILNVDLMDMDGKSADLSIYDLSGQLLDRRGIQALSKDVIDFDVRAYSAGIYTLSVKVDGMNRIAKQFTVTR